MGGGLLVGSRPSKPVPLRYMPRRARHTNPCRQVLPLDYVPRRAINIGTKRGFAGPKSHFFPPNCLIFEQIEVMALPLIRVLEF
jgi:hypothetical protein